MSWVSGVADLEVVVEVAFEFAVVPVRGIEQPTRPATMITAPATATTNPPLRTDPVSGGVICVVS